MLIGWKDWNVTVASSDLFIRWAWFQKWFYCIQAPKRWFMFSLRVDMTRVYRNGPQELIHSTWMTCEHCHWSLQPFWQVIFIVISSYLPFPSGHVRSFSSLPGDALHLHCHVVGFPRILFLLNIIPAKLIPTCWGVFVSHLSLNLRVYPWLRPLCYTSLGVFMLGFLLWNIDNIFCDSLRWVNLRMWGKCYQTYPDVKLNKIIKILHFVIIYSC